MKKLLVFLCTLAFLQGYSQQADTIRIMYYNVLNYPGTTPERVELFRKTISYAHPDIIVISELSTEEGANNLLDNGINVNGIDYYLRAEFIDGYDSDNMLFYNSNILGLHSQDTIQTALRLINEYKLFDKNSALTGDTVYLDFYSAHLKASTGSENEQLRLAECQHFTSYINNLENPENIFFGGDFNIYTADEPAYQHLITNSPVAISDPLGETWTGDWNNNPAYSNIHTQSTRSRQFGGGASGGLDDRFDFILCSDDVLNGNNYVQMIEGSYIPLGNDGNHFNDSINAPPNTAVPDSIANSLHYMSDHLPVIADIVVTTPPTIQSVDIVTPTENEILQGGTNYNIQWTSLNIENVNVYFKLYNENDWTEIANSIPAGNNLYEWFVPENINDSAYIKVETNENNDVSDTSDMFYIRDFSNVDNFSTKSDLRVYPNPSKGYITIESKGAYTTIQIFNLYGLKIKEFLLKDNTTIKLSSGMYLIKSLFYTQLIMIEE